jgi:Tol biopolymer transport system component
MSVEPDDPELIALGAAISDGARVDWDRVQKDAPDAEAEQLVAGLRDLATVVSGLRSISSAPPVETQNDDVAPARRWRHFVLFEAVGAGAFGTVHRAWDSQVEREVAVKLLPKHTAGISPLTEARNLARVRHGNVVTVHGADQDDEHIGIWMEFIEGETLAAMIRERGPMSPREVSGIGADLCHALSALHAAGLLHRDIKPHNVMREAGGRIVLMDFSGAQAVLNDRRPGTFSGTPLFMAPELFAGEGATVATDIYSLGVLLFFLLSGTVPVDGTSIAALKVAHANGLRKRLRDLRADLAAGVVSVVERATAPDPSARYQTAGEMEHALAAAAGSAVGHGLAPASPRALTLALLRVGGWRAAALAAAMMLLGIVAVSSVLRRPEVGPPWPAAAHFTVGPPYTTGSWPRVSPDGRTLVFGTLVEGRNRFWVRALDRLHAQPLLNTSAGETPFFSPDSRTLAFFADGKLKKIPLAGGEPQIVTDAPRPRGGTWSGNWILFSTDKGIEKVAADGSQLSQVTSLDSARGEYQHSWPEFLPGGRRFIFLIRSSQPDRDGLYLASLDGGEPARLTRANSRTAYANGHLLYVQDGTLQAHPFDPERGTFTGSPASLSSNIKYHAGADAAFDVSDSGVLVYSLLPGQASTRVTLFDRRGRESRTIAEDGAYRQPRLSPDGQRVVVEKIDYDRNGVDLWMFGVSGRSAVRLTSADAPDARATWSPDGSRIAFSSKRGTVFDVYTKAVDSAEPEQLLVRLPGDKLVEHWSPDGKYLVGTVLRSGLWILPVSGQEEPRLVRKDVRADTWQAEFSPDGRWLAYMSEESGSPEVYVEPFPTTGARWQISPHGGAEPHWSGNGKELFFLGTDGMLMALSVTGATWQRGRPTPLFRVSVPDLTGCGDYTVSHDGESFVVNVFRSDPIVPPVDVVANWPALLPK